METITKPSVVRGKLSAAAHRGGITLVLGAGLSIPRQIPNWNYLARLMWKKAFGTRRSPWAPSLSSVREMSQFLPIVFELAYNQLGPTKFNEILTRNIYANVKRPDRDFKESDESLAVIARLIVQEYYREKGRRIESVITLNADDLLEQAVNKLDRRRSRLKRIREPIVYPIARSTHSAQGGALRRPIPIYHIHGFLPSKHTFFRAKYDYMLVFTDTQYWSTSASALAFANRIMASALSEGRCIFVGLSMTDINLLRWLALRSVERDRDLIEVAGGAGPGDGGNNDRRLSNPRQLSIQRLFERHFWVRPKSDDTSGFISKFMRLRGVESVPIESWSGNSFRKLMEKCFPAPHKDL